MKTGMRFAKLLPALALVLALVFVVLGALPPGQVRGFDVDGFGHIPVLEGGRVKPLDSVARNALLVLRSKQTLRFQDRTIAASEWLLDLMFRPQVADTQPVFSIDDPEVLGLIGLQQTSDRYFNFSTLAPHLLEIEKQARAAGAIDSHEHTRFQNAIANLYQRIALYDGLKNTLQLAESRGLAAELEILSTPEGKQHQDELAQQAQFRPLREANADVWRNAGEALREAARGNVHPALPALARMASAYGSGEPEVFNRSLAEFRSVYAHAGTEAEMVLNRIEPFYKGMILYVLALLLLFVSWLWKRDLLQPIAFGLLIAGAVVHTAGLAFRVILQGRPPVTNLYSSAVFVGWGVVILGIVLEHLYRRGFGTAVSAAIGFCSLLVAQALATEGDTMEMMRAVLDSNFWLATHVVTITIGYSGTFLAGGIAIGYAIRKQVIADPDPATTKSLEAMVYGVVCFALFFSFVGTVLGGIWADQSWGRFWGWDPKENGALLIVLWNAIILHARSSKWVQERGTMAMVIFGNIITSFSWFGVNMLGVGLHSYGFMDKAFWWLSAFIGSQLLLTGVCLLPSRFWKSLGRA
jgi:ABC-type transport system involved in cytochrome c biogenesis permease subunit